MEKEKYAHLLQYTNPEYGVSQSFFEKHSTDNDSCIFLVSCLDREVVLYLEDSYESLTGYPPEKFINGGMQFWFPLIHPEDLSLVTGNFIQTQQELFKPGANKKQLLPMVLEYRFKQPDGDWCKIRETKYILYPGDNAVVDIILGKLELVNQDDKDSKNSGEIAHPKKPCTRMLEFAAIDHQKTHTKEGLVEQPKITTLTNGQQISKREKEILLLIAKGMSTKMIADKCSISINTVETHRRHLLKKLDVKNSMELVKEASKLFWFE